MAWFVIPQRPSVARWCGYYEFPLLNQEGQRISLGIMHVYTEHVGLWGHSFPYGTFSRRELGSWLRLRTDDHGPHMPEANWLRLGLRVAISFKGLGLMYVPEENVEELSLKL